jgi:hypothetical protein
MTNGRIHAGFKYLGLESLRLGHGGEIARMAGVDVKTVAQGRRQLLARQVTAERIREAGADDRH